MVGRKRGFRTSATNLSQVAMMAALSSSGRRARARFGVGNHPLSRMRFLVATDRGRDDTMPSAKSCSRHRRKGVKKRSDGPLPCRRAEIQIDPMWRAPEEGKILDSGSSRLGLAEGEEPGSNILQ